MYLCTPQNGKIFYCKSNYHVRVLTSYGFMFCLLLSLGMLVGRLIAGCYLCCHSLGSWMYVIFSYADVCTCLVYYLKYTVIGLSPLAPGCTMFMYPGVNTSTGSTVSVSPICCLSMPIHSLYPYCCCPVPAYIQGAVFWFWHFCWGFDSNCCNCPVFMLHLPLCFVINHVQWIQQLPVKQKMKVALTAWPFVDFGHNETKMVCKLAKSSRRTVLPLMRCKAGWNIVCHHIRYCKLVYAIVLNVWWWICGPHAVCLCLLPFL